MTRQLDFGGGQMHPVVGQDGRVLIGPQVVETSARVRLHAPWFDPPHFDGMNQFGHLWVGDGAGTEKGAESKMNM